MKGASATILASMAGWMSLVSLSNGHAFVPTAGDQTDTAASWMAEAGPAVAPFGHLVFCKRHPGECRPQTASIHHAPLLTRTRRAELDVVNRRINRRIHAAKDGSVDTWSLATRYGDCEDFAIAKRHELMARGWPASALLLATARIPGGINHAVLVVHTHDGDYVLDNLRSGVTRWNALPYRWLKRQSRTNPRRWVALRSGGSGAAMARVSPHRHYPQRINGSALPRARPILDAADRQGNGARQADIAARHIGRGVGPDDRI